MTRTFRSLALLLLLFRGSTTLAEAQPAPQPTAEPALERPGRYRLGPFYLTPRLRIGTIGLDTNVFYTAADRRVDLSASGGPGLEIVLPVRRQLRLRVDGGVGYVYFLRTTSQRRLTWDGAAHVEWEGVRTQLHLSGTQGRSFGRPSEDVDVRVATSSAELSGMLRRRLLGRTSIVLSGRAGRYETGRRDTFVGTDLYATMSRDFRVGGAALEQALTVKSRFVVEGEIERNDFLADDTRDSDRWRIAGGFRTDVTALVSGRALVGARWYRPRGAAAETPATYADLDATWHLTRRTRLRGTYNRDLAYTYLATAGRPTQLREDYSAGFEKELGRRFDVGFGARRTRARTHSAVRVRLPSGEVLESVRIDDVRTATAELGYRLGSALRVGARAGYSDRRSNIADFGIEGLLAGATVTLQP